MRDIKCFSRFFSCLRIKISELPCDEHEHEHTKRKTDDERFLSQKEVGKTCVDGVVVLFLLIKTLDDE